MIGEWTEAQVNDDQILTRFPKVSRSRESEESDWELVKLESKKSDTKIRGLEVCFIVVDELGLPLPNQKVFIKLGDGFQVVRFTGKGGRALLTMDHTNYCFPRKTFDAGMSNENAPKIRKLSFPQRAWMSYKLYFRRKWS